MTIQTQLQQLEKEISTRIIGQEKLVNRLIIALLADGHLLVEGAPGLAKTRAIKVLGDCIEGDFQRIQFTPDLLPADLTGTDIYNPQESTFHFQKGPLFHHLILADEINRAPAKVQAALLEAMAERQITVGSTTYPLNTLFLVMATQNPIEQEGTYPLPEAQLDRFLLHVVIDYPDASSEAKILALSRSEALAGIEFAKPDFSLSQETLFAARKECLNVHMADNLQAYLLQIILTTRNASEIKGHFSQWVEYGASPRATIALDRTARVHAWLAGRDFVTPDDIQTMAFDVLRHRVLLNYEAEAEGITPTKFIDELLNFIPVP